MAIICISRGTFSGGEAVAQQVAKRLGYPCLGREDNLATAATRYHIPTEALTATLGKRPSFWDKVVGERDFYLLCVRASLLEQAQGGRLVYHGYLGQLLLSEVSPVLRVRVIADPEFRLQAAMQQQRLTHPEALAYIEQVDKERREWVRFLFGVEWEDPSLYDIVLNLSRMTLDTATETVIGPAKSAEFQLASLKTLQDQALRFQVMAALAMDFRTREADLHVTANDGSVTIAGTTPWQEVLEAVPMVVRQVEGVKEVRSEITGATPLRPLGFY
jgi:cytidylate kinase